MLPRAARGLPAAALPLLAGLALGGVVLAGPARADFRLCNNTGSRVGVAVGYRDKDGWVSEGWWNVNARSCETVLNGALAARFYYVYAIDYDQGGEWSGRTFMCTREKEFTIRGFQDCLARGYDRTGFFEIDSGDQKSWTVQLSEQSTGSRPLPGTAAPTPSTPQVPTVQPGAPATSSATPSSPVAPSGTTPAQP